ncbi:CRISPR-associated autoregulator, DevR family [Candidatus Promineifilum breve]|uniref:CRISPR-associated autoregulator, DevR family n=1 Tax=Candidatus Promineifilum breve TaxID=1806508 RepID=A0A160T3H8_9CHLR|nr:DevR family CRISPR-associated autoregulator [Candidatus Promineifilum breve]CUS04324.2 CRISPR-associated autoregulator, DevR family [Candidatus Promineifilum breve]
MSVYSVSLSAQLTLDMHSLNNEGGEGNQIQTRMVNIVDGNGRLQNVNAISGDMIKHILAEHLHRIAGASGLPLCAGCRTFNANRISADEAYMAYIADKSDGESLTRMLQSCAMDDMLGNLITAGSKSLPRKSVVEFGWVVGKPEQTSSDSYFHVKYASERGDAKRKADSDEETRKANLGQAIFHRPANSGVYALIASIEAARIGFNDITQQYVLSEEERQARFKSLLEALLYTLVEPAGAMRGTQAPHIVDVSGVLTVSRDIIPAPTFSPLKEGYAEQLTMLCGTLNGIRPNALTSHHFQSLAEYAEKVSGLMAEMPYSMRYEG